MLDMFVEVMAATLARQGAGERLTKARDELMDAQSSWAVSPKGERCVMLEGGVLWSP